MLSALRVRPDRRPPRLVRVRPNVGDRQLDEAPFAFGFFARGAQQGLEPPTKSPATSDGFRHAGTSGSGSGAGGAGGGGTGAAAPVRSTRRIRSCATAKSLSGPTACTS